MKNIWLMGGFGNVLFQILAKNVLERKGYEVKYVTVLTKKNILTKWLKWSIHEELYSDFVNKHNINNIGLFRSIFIVLIASFNKRFYLNFIAVFLNDNFDFSKTPTNIFSYFQNKSFLSENREDLLLLCKSIRKNYSVEDLNNVVVHFRKGDSIWAKDSYYDKIKGLLQEEKGKILIVTDSLECAKNYFNKQNNITIVKSVSALDDFKILLSAKEKLYCAPSTFSWWAAHASRSSVNIIMPSLVEDKLGIYFNNSCVIINC